jgi:hypothetical protein
MDQKDLEELFEQTMFPDSSPAGVPEPGVPFQEIEVMGEDDSSVDLVMDDSTIDSILQRHIQNSTNWMGSQISTAQAKAMQYYLGLPEGDLSPPGIQGRSQIVDTTVSDQIEWLMPQLMEIFFASGNIVRFTPRKPGDEDAAQQMTLLVNYIINDLNPGFAFFLDWFKNSLLNKVGVAKVWWEIFDETAREEYSGLTDDQLAVLSDDPNIDISKITSYVDPNAERQALEGYHQQLQQYHQAMQQYAQAGGMAPVPPQQQAAPGQLPPPPPAHPNEPAAQATGSMPPQQMPQVAGPQGSPPQPPQMQHVPPPQPPQAPDFSKLPQLHNVVMLRSKKSGRVALSAMNPEDFLIDERSRRIEDGFCAHRLIKTISEIRASYPGAENFDVDQLSSDPQAETVQNSEVMYARESLQTVYKPQEVEDYGDESQRKVFLYECYLPIDCDGDGFAEWRKITRAGNALIENVVVDGPPFAALCPVPIPGLFFGRSLAELGMPMQLAKTGVLRAMVDNMNVQVNGRTWAIEGQVNIDDLLTNRPGGVVRVKSAQAVGPLTQGMADSQGAYQLLDYLDAASQERSGITKYSQGTDSDMLNPTATAYKGITQRADLRTKLIARIFAETGVKELVRLIQKVLMKHQDQKMTFELEGKWVDVDPRVWNTQFNMKVRVGLGTGDMGERVMMIQQFMQVMQLLMQGQLGIVTPQNIYYAAKELCEAMQIGNTDQFLTMPPPPGPPEPPPVPPEVQLAQAQMALEQQKFQHKQQLDAAQFQADQMLAQQKAQNQQEQALLHEKLLDQRTRDQFAQQQAWEREKFYAQLAATRAGNAEKNGFDAAQEIALNNTILHNADGTRTVIPTDAALAARQQDIDSAHRHMDRQQADQHHQDQMAAQQANAEADRQQVATVASQQSSNE